MQDYTDLALQVLQNCRNELYSIFPYLDGAFAALPCKPTADTAVLGTDGASLLFAPKFPVRLYGRNPAELRRGYLHLMLHCLFLHPFQISPPKLWNLACDMAVEQIIQRENRPRLQTVNPVRDHCLAVLGTKTYAAEQILQRLDEGAFPYSVGEMEAAFCFDDHGLWHCDPQDRERWAKILAYTVQNRRRAGSRAGHDSDTVSPEQGGAYDYRRYLQKFAVPREELLCDWDSFDYIYYHLGMERYGNLPLIEPLEYREGHKLEELVIAIDTSGSCSREVVRDFLSETYRILSQRENFFDRMQVYLIQCDCMVQDVALIRSAEEWKNYSRTITIQGRGGTDFTPVFRYVEQLRAQRKLKNLKALLYFTDGDGFFPRVPTDYETAFVFLEKTEKMDVVPKWAAKLLVR